MKQRLLTRNNNKYILYKFIFINKYNNYLYLFFYSRTLPYDHLIITSIILCLNKLKVQIIIIISLFFDLFNLTLI